MVAAGRSAKLEQLPMKARRLSRPAVVRCSARLSPHAAGPQNHTVRPGLRQAATSSAGSGPCSWVWRRCRRTRRRRTGPAGLPESPAGHPQCCRRNPPVPGCRPGRPAPAAGPGRGDADAAGHPHLAVFAVGGVEGEAPVRPFEADRLAHRHPPGQAAGVVAQGLDGEGDAAVRGVPGAGHGEGMGALPAGPKSASTHWPD
jgi:hypothetical protein